MNRIKKILISSKCFKNLHGVPGFNLFMI